MSTENKVNKKKNIQIIISILAAIILWIIVIYNENPTVDFTVSSVPVTIKGERELNERDLMVINKELIPEASADIRGRRQDIINVMSNITSSVDVSWIDSEGIYELKPIFEVPSNAVYISKRNTLGTSVEIVPIEEKEVDLKVIQKNKEKNKSYIVESLPLKDKIKVRGEHNDLELINHASIYIDVMDMKENNSDFYQIVYEDENDNEVIAVNRLYTDFESIEVNNYVYDMITLDVNVSIPKKFDEKYTVEMLDVDTKQIQAGIKEVGQGESVTEITNKADFDDLIVGTHEYTMNLMIPVGIYIPEDKRQIKVKLEVFEKTEKFVTIPIKVENQSSKNYTLDKENVNVLISGPEEKLKEENVTANVNLDNVPKEAGEYEAKVEFSTKEKDISIVEEDIKIRVKIN